MNTHVAYAQVAGKPNGARYLGWGLLLAALA
ncbi:phosphonate ABC transporter permease, partial [Pseudomonas syringae pv. actinidiae ICMP 18804]